MARGMLPLKHLLCSLVTQQVRFESARLRLLDDVYASPPARARCLARGAAHLWREGASTTPRSHNGKLNGRIIVRYFQYSLCGTEGHRAKEQGRRKGKGLAWLTQT